MKFHMFGSVVAIALALGTTTGLAGHPIHSCGFKSSSIRGIAAAEVVVDGGGAYRPEKGFVQASGNFLCTADITRGPLAGRRAGDGVRWSAARLVASTPFPSAGDEAAKIATTGESTVVMVARFFRAGDPAPAPVPATMIVSGGDLDADTPGVQNVWIEGVGSGSTEASFQ